MALKDWKKTRKNVWRKDNTTLEIEEIDSDDYNYKYLVFIHGYKWNGNGFKTKSQALKYAKSYMRKH